MPECPPEDIPDYARMSFGSVRAISHPPPYLRKVKPGVIRKADSGVAFGYAGTS